MSLTKVTYSMIQNAPINVFDYGAKGDGITDDTVAIQNAMTAAGLSNMPLQFAGGTYIISASSVYALTVPDNIVLLGVPGSTTIKLIAASVSCHMIGRSAASTYFRMEGITLDGNSSVISAVNVDGVYLPQAQVGISRSNVYKNMNDLGSLAGGKGFYVANLASPNLGEYAESIGDQYLNLDGNPFQTYYIARNLVEDCYCTDNVTSFTDINGQTIPNVDYAKTRVSNNVVICSPAFRSGASVLSLLGNDVECVGNKINGGDIGIVCHVGTAETLVNYLISGNSIWETTSAAIVVNQSSGTSATNGNVVVSNNMIYQPARDGISVVGTYAGGSTTPQLGCIVTGNIIYDYLTNNPNPDSEISGIRLQSVVNCVIANNNILGPRWAGITCSYDGRNIDIIGNVISDHQGRTTSATRPGAPIFITGGNATAYLGNINVTGNTIRNWATQTTPVSSVRAGAIVVNEAKAQDISIRGNRAMTGNTSGISLFACVNVTAQDNEVTGFYSEALNTSLGVGTNCQLTYAISGRRYDTTANRPTLQSTQAGYQYWDTTLTKPIWWNGSVWKDTANGTV